VTGGETLVENDSAELLFFVHFWVFEVRRFRKPTNKISVALSSCVPDGLVLNLEGVAKYKLRGAFGVILCDTQIWFQLNKKYP
jgi:hypothetical protein